MNLFSKRTSERGNKMNEGQMYTEATIDDKDGDLSIVLVNSKGSREIRYLPNSSVAGVYGDNNTVNWGNSWSDSPEDDMAFSALVQGY